MFPILFLTNGVGTLNIYLKLTQKYNEKKYNTIRQLKSGLSNFARTYPREGRTIQDKVAIINRNLFGEDQDNWKNTWELRQYVIDLAKQLNEEDRDEYSVMPSSQYYHLMRSCKQIVDVLDYMADKDDVFGRLRDTPPSLAVYEPSKTLADYFHTDIPEKQKNTRQLFRALSKENYSLAVKLIKDGADPNVKNKNGTPVLSYATGRCWRSDSDYNKAFPVVKALIEAGADVNLTDNDGQTSLCYAENPKVALYLIDNGADVNAPDKEGNLPADNQENCNYHDSALTTRFYEIGDPNTFEDSFVSTFTPEQIASEAFARDYVENLRYLTHRFSKRGGWKPEHFKRFADIAKRWTKIKNPEINPNNTIVEQFALFKTVADCLSFVYFDDGNPKKAIPLGSGKRNRALKHIKKAARKQGLEEALDDMYNLDELNDILTLEQFKKACELYQGDFKEYRNYIKDCVRDVLNNEV